MKTSILVSGFAALCLLLTFAEAPRRNSSFKMDVASANNFSIPTTVRVTMLPGVVITAERKRETANTVPVIPSGNLNYLKFDVTEYLEADAFNPDEAVVLPEATSNDYSYLKFKIRNYFSELSCEEVTELPVPVNENNINVVALLANQFDYLKFDVIQYCNSSSLCSSGQYELPEE